MTPKTRDAVLREAEKMFQTLGASGFEDAVESTCQGFERILTILNTVRTRKRAIETLDSLEMSAAEEKLLIFAIKMMPRQLRYGAKQISGYTQAELPAPPTG